MKCDKCSAKNVPCVQVRTGKMEEVTHYPRGPIKRGGPPLPTSMEYVAEWWCQKCWGEKT